MRDGIDVVAFEHAIQHRRVAAAALNERRAGQHRVAMPG